MLPKPLLLEARGTPRGRYPAASASGAADDCRGGRHTEASLAVRTPPGFQVTRERLKRTKAEPCGTPKGRVGSTAVKQPEKKEEKIEKDVRTKRRDGQHTLWAQSHLFFPSLFNEKK